MPVGERIEGAVVVAHVEQRDEHRAAFQAADFFEGGFVNLENDVGRQRRFRGRDLGAGGQIGLVGEVRTHARAPFDDHGQTRGAKFFHRFRRGRHTGLAGGCFSGYPYLHRFHELNCIVFNQVFLI